jgi:hypothetical protein
MRLRDTLLPAGKLLGLSLTDLRSRRTGQTITRSPLHGARHRPRQCHFFRGTGIYYVTALRGLVTAKPLLLAASLAAAIPFLNPGLPCE